MSNRGKTLLGGHALQDEGKAHYTSTGIFRWKGGHAKCECGLLSEPNITQAAAKRWHREHKDTERAARMTGNRERAEDVAAALEELLDDMSGLYPAGLDVIRRAIAAAYNDGHRDGVGDE